MMMVSVMLPKQSTILIASELDDALPRSSAEALMRSAPATLDSPMTINVSDGNRVPLGMM